MAVSMRAAVMRSYGGPEVLGVEEVPRPQATGRRLLVKVRATSVNPIDWRIRRGELRFLTGNRFPRIPGRDFCGEVVETGPGTRSFRAGDEVYGMLGGLFGASAEYAAVSERLVAAKPPSLSHEEAAAVPLAGLTALQALRDAGGLRGGRPATNVPRQVLVNGASGGVGTFAVQLARSFGAGVTAVCSSRNADLVRDLGAGEVIDYNEEDFARRVGAYDIIFDAVGNRNYAACRRALSPNGVYVTTEPGPRGFLEQSLTLPSSGKKARVVLVRNNARDLEFLLEMIEQGKVRPVIDGLYPLAEVSDAHAYSETKRARGKIVVLTTPRESA